MAGAAYFCHGYTPAISPPVAGLLLWAIKYVELVLGWAGWPAMRDDARRLEDMRLFAG